MKLKSPVTVKYRLTIIPTVLYLIGIVGLFALFYTRHSAGFWQLLPLDAGGHLSNLCIMFLILAPVGIMTVITGTPAKSFWIVLLTLAGINILYDGWIPILNTPDFVDVIFGLFGAALAALLFVIARNTRKPVGLLQ